jgi:hypothetical protein
MSKIYVFEDQFGNKADVSIWFRQYPNKRVGIAILDNEGMPFATATVNIPEEKIEDDEVFIKDYSENAGMLSFLVKNNIVAEPHRFVKSGWVTIPVCRIIPNQK